MEANNSQTWKCLTCCRTGNGPAPDACPTCTSERSPNHGPVPIAVAWNHEGEALVHECPFCKSLPGERCTQKKNPFQKVPCHRARIVLAIDRLAEEAKSDPTFGPCELCGGEVYYIGTLGKRAHGKCRACHSSCSKEAA